jgi:hypothetical protein
MKVRPAVFLCVAFCVLLPVGSLSPEDPPEPSGSGGRPKVSLFDTGASSAEPLKAESVASREGWTKIESGQKPSSFKGDAVLVNGSMAVVLRKGAAGAEVYAKGAEGFTLRAKLVPVGETDKPGISSAAVRTNDASEVAVEGTFGDAVVGFSLKAADAVVRTRSVKGAGGVRVEAPSRFGVLPDFFADDMVVDATKIPPDRAEVPSENFFMNMIDGGNSMVITIWDKNERDVEVSLSGEGNERVIGAVDAFYGKGGSVWVAVLEDRGIWASTELTKENAKKVVRLDWNIPFDAKWKVDFTRADGTVDSWDLKLHLRRRSMWATGIGRYNYPCWSKWDMMQRSLGVGPCAYIMDVEGQKVHSKGLYTCAVFDQLAPLFAHGKQKDERLFVKKTLNEGLVFVTAIRRRIEAFCDFSKEMLAYLGEQKKAHPEHEAFIAKMETLARNVDKHNARRVTSPEGVGKWITDFHSDIVADIPKASGERLVGNIRGVGGRQDDLVARCRMEVKLLRQHAAMEAAKNPKVAPIAREIRERTQKILRGKYGHEGR